MNADLIGAPIFTAPCADDRLREVEREELMHVGSFVAQAPVEGFDIAIVGWRAWSGEIQLQAAVERPRFDGLRGEICTVIDGAWFRVIARRHVRLERTDDTLSGERTGDFQQWNLATPLIDLLSIRNGRPLVSGSGRYPDSTAARDV